MKQIREIAEAAPQLTRRGFLFGAAGLGAGAALASVPSRAFADEGVVSESDMPENVKPIDTVSEPDSYDEEVDVIVVGAGISGLCAAVTAMEAGANVAVLEKTNLIGGHSNFSQMWQTACVPPDEDYYNMMISLPHPYARQNPALIRRFAKELGDNVKWMEDMGDYMVTSAFNVDGMGHVPVPEDFEQPENPADFTEEAWYQWFPYNARGHSRVLIARLEELGGKVQTSTAATALIADSEGAIVGVKAADAEGNEKTFKGIVVLTTGGYMCNDDMMKYYLDDIAYSGISKVIGLPGATGDGIRLGQGAGAWVANMNCLEQWSGGADDPEIAKNGPRSYYTAANQLEKAPSLCVNELGERFCNEFTFLGDVYGYLGTTRLCQPNQTSFTILDSKMCSAKGLTTCFFPLDCGFPVPWFDEDLEDEIARGVIVEAQTLEELAEKLELPKETFLATVERYNGMCEKGVDDDFFKPAIQLTAISEAPFYAVKGRGTSVPGTWGGMKTNTDMQVIKADGTVIPGLYAAGETVTYCGELSRCIPSGRIAGSEAAAEALGK